jgi:hypothetical protein
MVMSSSAVAATTNSVARGSLVPGSKSTHNAAPLTPVIWKAYGSIRRAKRNTRAGTISSATIDAQNPVRSGASVTATSSAAPPAR